MTGGTIKAQQKGGILIDAKGTSDIKDGHNDGSMRASEEMQANVQGVSAGQPFSAGERRLRRRRLLQKDEINVRKKGGRNPMTTREMSSHDYPRRRGRELLMIDDTDKDNEKLLNPKSLEGTLEDPMSPQNSPYMDPRIVPSSDETKDASNGLMYNNPDSILMTEMHVCINEDNMELAKALFMNIASKDVEVKCRMYGT